MSYAPRATAGFEFAYNKVGHGSNPVPYELKPDTAFTLGQLVVMEKRAQQANQGQILPATNSSSLATQIVIGVMAEAVAQADNPALEVTYGLVYDNPLNVYKVTLEPGVNGDVPIVDATYTTTTRVKSTVGVGTNDRCIGCIIYFYEGPLKGIWRTVSDSDATEDYLTVVETLPAAPTAADKFYATTAATYDTAATGLNIGSTGVNPTSTGAKVHCSTAVASATGLLTIVGFNGKDMTFDVMLRGTPGTGAAI